MRKLLLIGMIFMKKIYLLFSIFCLIFFHSVAQSQNSYTLLEGKKAQERLDIQNDFNRDNLIKAFKEVSAMSNVEGMTVVDFGCGTSSAYPDIKTLIGSSGKYIGIDESAKQIEFNRARFNKVDYIVGNEQTKETKEALASADIIYIRFVVMHQKNPKHFLKIIYNIAKPDAFIIIQEPETDKEKRKFIAAKYPFATELCDFKTQIGKKRGLNYNFAVHIEPALQSLRPKKLIHYATYNELPMSQAKVFLGKTLNEIHIKDPSVLSEELLTHYLNIISKLPEGKDDKWRLDLMHTIIAQKS